MEDEDLPYLERQKRPEGTSSGGDGVCKNSGGHVGKGASGVQTDGAFQRVKGNRIGNGTQRMLASSPFPFT